MKKLLNYLQVFFKTALGKQVINYALFYAVIWAFHLIFVSVIAFFHLILNHNIGTIADWIVDRGWIEIMVTKLLIFFFAIQFMKLRNIKYAHIRGMLRNAVAFPRHEVFVSVIFLLIAVMSVGEIKMNHAYIIDVYRFLISILGTLVFYGVDLVMILILDVFNPLKTEKEEKNKMIIFSFLFWLFTRMTFIYEQSVSFSLFPYFFLLLYFAYWRRRNWTLPLFLLASFFVPAYALLGLDPVWGSSFTLFYMQRPIHVVSIICMVLILFSYLEYQKRKFPEYIYRD